MESKKTLVCDLGGIHKCLHVAHEFIDHPSGHNACWNPNPETTVQAQSNLLGFIEHDSVLEMEELRAFASWDVKDINQALEEAGFDIRLEESDTDPNSKTRFAVVSILLAGIKWKEEGEKVPLRIYQKEVEAFRIESDFGVAALDGYDEPVFCISTENGDEMFLMRTEEVPEDAFDVYSLAREMSDLSFMYRGGYDGADIPMINLDTQPNIEWLIGMWHPVASKPPYPRGDVWWEIAQAKQQVIFKMNHLGASVKSATAVDVAIRTTSVDPRPKSYYKFDGPFYCVIKRPGVGIYFAGYLAPDCFENPGELDT